MKKRLYSICFTLLVFLIITFSSCFVSSAASPKVPQAKITHIWSYDWYEENKEYFIENNYVPKYVYYDYGDYNDNSGYYVKVIEAKCRKAKGSNVKYQFAIREGKKKWEKYPPDGRSTLNVYDFPKNITISIKVRYVKTKNGKNYYGKWSPVIKESTHDKEVHPSNIYTKKGYVKGYIKGAFKGEKIKVKIGKKTYTTTVKKTAKKYPFKINIGRHSPGITIKILLTSQFGDTIYTYTNWHTYYAPKIKKGYTKKQVKNTKYWGSPDDTASSSGGWSYWYYDDGSYIGFKNGRVRYWYDAAG